MRKNGLANELICETEPWIKVVSCRTICNMMLCSEGNGKPELWKLTHAIANLWASGFVQCIAGLNVGLMGDPWKRTCAVETHCPMHCWFQWTTEVVVWIDGGSVETHSCSGNTLVPSPTSTMLDFHIAVVQRMVSQRLSGFHNKNQTKGKRQCR